MIAAAGASLVRQAPGSTGARGSVALHHEAGTALGHVGDDRSSAVQFRYGSQIDGERQYHLLTFAQAQVGGFDKYARRTQIDGLAQFSAAARDSDIDDGSCTVPRVQAAFHLNEPRVFLVVVRRDRSHYAVVRPCTMHRFNLIAR